MKINKKILAGILVTGVVIIAIPAGIFAFRGHMYGRGQGMYFMNTEARSLLESKGVVLPSNDAIKQFEQSMMQAEIAMKKLPLADQNTIEKAKRDAMRAKGITLPTEEEITKMNDAFVKIRETMKNLSISERWQLKGSFGRHGRGEK